MLEEIRDLERGGEPEQQIEGTALGNRPGFGRALTEISASIKKIFKRYVGVELTADQRKAIDAAIGKILVFGESIDAIGSLRGVTLVAFVAAARDDHPSSRMAVREVGRR